MTNKVWFFGDSFINGYECKPNDRYYQASLSKDKKIISDYIGENLNMIPINLAHYGYSNENILFSIMKNLSRFEKNDLICIFDTHSIRSSFVDEELDFYNSWPENSYIKLNDKELLTKMWHKRTKHENNLKVYYKEVFDKLTIGLNSFGLKTFYYHTDNNYFEPLKFETINKDTDINGEVIQDGHWSFKGHKQAGEYFTNKILNKTQWI